MSKTAVVTTEFGASLNDAIPLFTALVQDKLDVAYSLIDGPFVVDDRLRDKKLLAQLMSVEPSSWYEDSDEDFWFVDTGGPPDGTAYYYADGSGRTVGWLDITGYRAIVFFEGTDCPAGLFTGASSTKITQMRGFFLASGSHPSSASQAAQDFVTLHGTSGLPSELVTQITAWINAGIQ